MPKLRAGSTEQAGFRVGYSFTYQRSVRIERQLTRNFMQTVTSGGRRRRLFRQRRYHLRWAGQHALWRARHCSLFFLPQLVSKDQVDTGGPGVCRIPQGRARFRIEVFSHSTLLRHLAEIYAQIVCQTALTGRIQPFGQEHSRRGPDGSAPVGSLFPKMRGI
jgi:hypothetical protein